jgi:putative toxin-antitoxin system antitoxin component (TIGR02293 family)
MCEKSNFCKSEEEVTIDRVFTRASEILGSYENAIRWLLATVPSLGNNRPIDLLGSTSGIQTVLNVLGQIGHGIPS